MSLFEDKEYENLDWLNKAIEAPSFSLNEVLAELPDEWEIPPEYILNNHHFSKQGAINNWFYLNKYKNQDHLPILAMAFDIEVLDGTDVDFGKQTVSKPVVIRKTAHTFEGKLLKEVVHYMIRKETDFIIETGREAVVRANEIMNLLECEHSSSVVMWKRLEDIRDRLLELFDEDIWKIRNIDLFIKALTWIRSYIDVGDLSAITNLTKLKCMTHTGNPIYSMKEII